MPGRWILPDVAPIVCVSSWNVDTFLKEWREETAILWALSQYTSVQSGPSSTWQYLLFQWFIDLAKSVFEKVTCGEFQLYTPVRCFQIYSKMVLMPHHSTLPSLTLSFAWQMQQHACWIGQTLRTFPANSWNSSIIVWKQVFSDVGSCKREWEWSRERFKSCLMGTYWLQVMHCLSKDETKSGGIHWYVKI